MMTTQMNRESKLTLQRLNILLVGNNPMEIATILDKINQVHDPKISTEIAFNLRTMLARLMEFEPHYVLMDDNIGKDELREAVNVFFRKGEPGNMPITILKNSNYQESVLTSNNLDYVLKQNFSMDLLMFGFKNFLKNRRTHVELYRML